MIGGYLYEFDLFTGRSNPPVLAIRSKNCSKTGGMTVGGARTPFTSEASPSLSSSLSSLPPGRQADGGSGEGEEKREGWQEEGREEEGGQT